jgi:hypothetical protein
LFFDCGFELYIIEFEFTPADVNLDGCSKYLYVTDTSRTESIHLALAVIQEIDAIASIVRPLSGFSIPFHTKIPTKFVAILQPTEFLVKP